MSGPSPPRRLEAAVRSCKPGEGRGCRRPGAYALRPTSASPRCRSEYDGSKFQLRAPEPNPKRGGVLRYGVTCRPPHFDVHQSGTFNNLGAQGCMFDNLIRRDPRDSGKTIIPDLAHSWEIAKDGKTYTFFLRKDVQFHDGAELTADDVKATFDRISKPPAGISIPRCDPVHRGERDQCARQAHDRVQAVRAAARQLHHVGASPAAGTSSCARRRWRTISRTCGASSTIPAPARSRARGASRTKSG